MTAITLSSGGTLKSDNAENQLLELATFIKLTEQTPAKNPTNSNNLQITYNAQTLLVTINYSMPAVSGINTSGQPITTAANYLINTGFESGSDGTFKSTSPESYFLELITYLQIQESNPAKNPNSENNVTFTYNSDENKFSGTATLFIDISIQPDGSNKIIVNEYLRD
jgi:hypothetical protein